jgi:hypothetical protein
MQAHDLVSAGRRLVCSDTIPEHLSAAEASLYPDAHRHTPALNGN